MMSGIEQGSAQARTGASNRGQNRRVRTEIWAGQAKTGRSGGAEVRPRIDKKLFRLFSGRASGESRQRSWRYEGRVEAIDSGAGCDGGVVSLPAWQRF